MLFQQLATVENSESLHLARLLLILRAMAGRDKSNAIEGLTKLAKLDFLLRYPLYLERALQARHTSTSSVEPEPHERQSVESSMVRYRFGPWDARYRRFLNIMAAKRLIRVNLEGRTVVINLTDEGFSVAERIASLPQFEQLERRAQLLKHFDLTATNLMRFIYETFPEIGSLRSGKVIQ